MLFTLNLRFKQMLGKRDFLHHKYESQSLSTLETQLQSVNQTNIN